MTSLKTDSAMQITDVVPDVMDTSGNLLVEMKAQAMLSQTKQVSLNASEEFALMLMLAIRKGEMPNSFNWESVKTRLPALGAYWKDKNHPVLLMKVFIFNPVGFWNK